MTCGEARQYIFAFLDNELDSALSLEVQQHIERCPHCARECEIENAVRRELAGKLQTVEDLSSFDESAFVKMLRIGTATPAGASRQRRRYWKIGVPGAIAAALLVTVTLFVANRAGTSANGTLADVLVDDFVHFVTGAKPLQVVSADAEEVSRWLREQTALAVRVPSVDPAIGRLEGGRKCKINDKPAAFAIYQVGEATVSVVALQESDEALAHMKRIDRDGHTHWVDHCRGHTVLACRRGELIYAIVSRLPEESLLPLMPPAEG